MLPTPAGLAGYESDLEAVRRRDIDNLLTIVSATNSGRSRHQCLRDDGVLSTVHRDVRFVTYIVTRVSMPSGEVHQSDIDALACVKINIKYDVNQTSWMNVPFRQFSQYSRSKSKLIYR